MDKTREILHGKCHELKVQLRHQRCKLNGDDLESVNVKTISVLWVVILLTIALTACAVHQQTISQQSAVTSIATLPVAYTTQARDVLLYPIVNKVLMSSDLEALNSVVTRQGAAIKITSHSALILNDSVNIVEWDIKACNGVIYVVDRMLTVPGANTGETAQASQETAPVEATVVPEAVSASCQAGQSIAAILRSQERFSDFVGALESAGLMDKLDQDGAYTVFAVSNGAFVAPTLEASSNKITICHATGSATNPYEEITINVNGLNGHDQHADDIIPAPAGGCPVKLTPVPDASGKKITICHATGSAKNPYVEITISVNGLNGHNKHQGDIIPAPAGGCSAQQSAATSVATNVAEKPVVDTAQLRDILLYHIVHKALIYSDLATIDSVVTREGAAIKISSHSALVLNDSVNIVEWDIKACNGVIYVVDQMLTIPGANTGETAQAPQETAPVKATEVSEAVSASCQAGQSIAAILRSQERFSDFVGALESAGLMDKLGQDGAYTVFAIPNGVFVTSTLEASSKKITICHATGSATNPYEEITISVNGLNGHDQHNDDIIPAPAGGCPAKLTPVPDASGKKITICHATGSKTNPYVEITISVNGLNGHDRHNDDIIPAPAGGCPSN